uniref:Uncharacterized protein n=1 Tax=Anguilla anguilla TaxID=7936 RepID=A0A0E9TAY4_ANGAN
MLMACFIHLFKCSALFIKDSYVDTTKQE